MIDPGDAAFAELLLWIDENHDGISQPNELHHLAEMGVTHIRLNFNKNKSYTDANGNFFQFRGSVITSGSKKEHQAWDVVLKASMTAPPPSSSVSLDVTYCSLTPHARPTLDWDVIAKSEHENPTLLACQLP